MNVIFFTYRIFIDIIMFWQCATFVNVNTCFAHNTFSIIKLSTWIDKSLLLHSLCSVPITTYCGWFLRLNVIIFVHRSDLNVIHIQKHQYIYMIRLEWFHFHTCELMSIVDIKNEKQRTKYWSLNYLTEFHWT